MKTKTQINTIVKTNTIWTSSDMTKFIVSKVQKNLVKFGFSIIYLMIKVKNFLAMKKHFFILFIDLII